MSDFLCKIDGRDARPPDEYRGIQIELNNSEGSVVSVLGGAEAVQGRLTNTQFSFVHENADLLNARILPGALGAFWGVPLEFHKGNLKLFDGYISLTKDPTFSCEKVTANIVERKQKDWLYANADGISFDYLESIGLINSGSYLRIPYITSSIPDYKEALILSVTAFMLTMELQRTIKDLVNILSDLSGVFSTIAGVLKLIYFITFLALLIFAITKLIGQILKLFIQPVKYHYGMTILKHFEVLCQHLGYTFSSSYFQNISTNITDINGSTIANGYWGSNLVWMPRKSKKGAILGYTPKEKGYYQGSVGDFIREMCKDFNAKVKIVGNVFHFERRDKKSKNSIYQIPNVRREMHGINASELSSTHFFEFALDSLDTNTITDINGSNAKVISLSKNNGVDGTNELSGLVEYRPNCALGRRKDSLTEIEVSFAALFTVLQPIINTLYSIANTVIRIVASVVRAINKVIKALNNLPKVNISLLNVPSTNFARLNLVASINNRIGMLHLSDDLTGEAKMLYLDSDNKVNVNAHNILSAENLLNKYHFVEMIAPSNGKPNGNQYYIWKVENVPFCKEDFELIRGITAGDGEANIITPEGNEGQIDSILWNIWKDTADITYRENKLYSDNLKYTTLKNTGT